MKVYSRIAFSITTSHSINLLVHILQWCTTEETFLVMAPNFRILACLIPAFGNTTSNWKGLGVCSLMISCWWYCCMSFLFFKGFFKIIFYIVSPPKSIQTKGWVEIILKIAKKKKDSRSDVKPNINVMKGHFVVLRYPPLSLLKTNQWYSSLPTLPDFYGRKLKSLQQN